jgi:methyl-accepting chemotaxis protein
MKNKHIGIKVKLVLSLSTIILIAFVTLSIYNYQHSKRLMVERIEKSELPEYADNALLKIQKMLENGLKSIDVVSNDSHFLDLITKPQNREAEIQTYLFRYATKYNLRLNFVSMSNNIFYGSVGAPLILTKKADAWFFHFLENKSDRIFSIDMDYQTKSLKLWVDEKIYDTNHKLLGIISIGMDVNEVRDFVMSLKFDNAGQMMMVDSKGGIKMHADSTKWDVEGMYKDGQTLASLPGMKDIAAELIKGDGTTLEFKTPDSDTKIVISRYIPEFDWYMLMEVSKKQIVNPIFGMFISNLIWGLIITILTVVLVIIFTTNLINKPLDKITVFINSFAQGKLNADIQLNSNDEMGDLVNYLTKMQKKLIQTLNKITEGSNIITSASTQIKDSSQNMASGANEQAANIEEISGSMEEMLAKIAENKLNALDTEKIAYKAQANILLVHSSVNETSKAMEQINSKVSVISEIAAKTDLLAINASIEASRAGDAGKGFAIVAQEVRKLAEKSRDAAILISQLSRNSMLIAAKSIELLNDVMPDVEKTAKLVKEIAVASEKQNAGSQAVNRAIFQLSHVAQQNAASAEELAVSADVFNDQALLLNHNISYFDLGKS